MATQIEPRERLQPALLDRLIDPAPSDRKEAETQRVMTKAQLRQAVMRDLSWLLNATRMRDQQIETYPNLAGSVVNYGLPPMSGQLASKMDISALERAIKECILRFEPRLLADTLEVRAIDASSVLDTHNMIEFQIHAHLWAQPVPLEILLRTRLDLEAGVVEVTEAAASPSSAR